MKFIYFLAASMLIFVSCEKEETTDNTPNETAKLAEQFSGVLNTLSTFRTQITALSAQMRALEKVSIKKNLNFRLNQQLELLFLVPLKLITFRMCHEFGAFKVKYMINLFNYLHLI